MADNTTLPGTGDVIASDEITGVKYQRIKVGYGADGSYTDQDAKLATETTLDARTGSLTEGAPASDTASSGINGRLQRIAQRLTSLIALIPAALTGGGGMKVGVVDALPAGTNAIGKLAANSGVDIGDVDVTSLPSRSTADATALPATVLPVQAIVYGVLGGGTYAINLDGGSSDNIGGQVGLSVSARPLAWNEASWDRVRNNSDVTLLASAARTATTASSDQTNYNGRRLLLIVNITSAGIGSITPTLQVKDSISGTYVTIWTAAAALIANGTYSYLFAEGAAEGSFTEILPFGLPARTWRSQLVSNNANSVTASASGVVGV